MTTHPRKPQKPTTTTSIANTPIDMKRVGVIILGGGRGSRLSPLTMSRCKPAMCYGGRYRLIDIPISNAINSGCQQIYILTQFLSRSLHQHILTTYRFGSLSRGFIELLSAEEKPENISWFQGTADAVRHHLNYFIETPVDYFLILSGDQLYHMDFKEIIQFAQKTDADAVVAALPIGDDEVRRMGALQIDDKSFIKEFHEKPSKKAVLDHIHLTSKQLSKFNIQETKKRHYLGSMGIYLFKRKALINLLNEDPREDFGKHLIPSQVAKGKIAAHIHSGYWEDIGTIKSFYEANMALVGTHPPFNCYDEAWPIFVGSNNLPGATLGNTRVSNSLFCEGCRVNAKEITNTIIGPRVTIGNGTAIRESYIMGNDFYTAPQEAENLPKTLGIGNNCRIESAIIDNNVSIGNNVKLVNKKKLSHYDSDLVYIRDGIVVVPRGKTIPDGFTL